VRFRLPQAVQRRGRGEAALGRPGRARHLRRANAAAGPQAPAQPADLLGGPVRHRRAEGREARGRQGHGRRPDAPHRGAEQPGGEVGHPGTGPHGRRDRRHPGPQPRHHRRQRRQQRPGGRLPLRRAGPRRDGRHRQAPHRGRRLLPRHVHHGAGAGRAADGDRVPHPREGRLRQDAEPRQPLRYGRRLRGEDQRRRPCGCERRRPRRVPADGNGAGPVRQLVARRGGGDQAGVRRPQQRHPRQRRVPRAPGHGDGQAGGRRRRL
ncbi:MAG: Aerobic carbon monoxide dehydrogenase (quinone), medium chain, partial [uncultured Acetobacteraceae bacterium]